MVCLRRFSTEAPAARRKRPCGMRGNGRGWVTEGWAGTDTLAGDRCLDRSGRERGGWQHCQDV